MDPGLRRLVLVALAASPIIAPPALGQVLVSEPGTWELTLAGSGRRYTLVIPERYAEADTVPLIVSLHFGGPVTPYIGRSLIEQLIEPALDGLGAVIVAPDSAANGWTNPVAEQHVLELVDFIEANYRIDRSKTLLIGYSMGAAGTWYLAPRHADRFEAAIPIAGIPHDTDPANWATPTYAINSTVDELIPIDEARSAVAQLQAGGAPVRIDVVRNITHFQIPRYRRHLRNAIPWIEQVWMQD